MNAESKIVLEAFLTNNLVFMSFFAVFLPLLTGLTVKKSIFASIKYCLVFIIAGIISVGVIAQIPQEWMFANLLGLLFISYFAARAVRAWGELQGEFAGIPRFLFFIPVLAGAYGTIWFQSFTSLEALLYIFGSALGLIFGVILTVSLIEQIRISEAPQWAKRLGGLFLAMSILALSLSGFQFL